jgi:hypothetical protein
MRTCYEHSKDTITKCTNDQPLDLPDGTTQTTDGIYVYTFSTANLTHSQEDTEYYCPKLDAEGTDDDIYTDIAKYKNTTNKKVWAYLSLSGIGSEKIDPTVLASATAWNNIAYCMGQLEQKYKFKFDGLMIDVEQVQPKDCVDIENVAKNNFVGKWPTASFYNPAQAPLETCFGSWFHSNQVSGHKVIRMCYGCNAQNVLADADGVIFSIEDPSMWNVSKRVRDSLKQAYNINVPP